MAQKQVISMTVCSLVVMSLFLMISCGKQKTKSKKKIEKTINAVKSIDVKEKISTNLIINPSFEKGRIFNSGAYVKGKISKEKPVGWTTKNQLLTDFTGWASNEAHDGKHSLRIKNIGGTDAFWKGEPIILKAPANVFEFSVWSKAKNIKKKTERGEFQLAFDVYIKSDSNRETKKIVLSNISLKDHDWEKTSGKLFSSDNFTKIVPYIIFHDVGTVYIDDFTVRAFYQKGKELFNSNKDKKVTGDLTLSATRNGGKLYKFSGFQKILTASFIPVDSKKMFRLSGEFKSFSKRKSLLYFGLIPYNKDKVHINNYTIKYRKNTGTELARKCSKGDKVVYIKDGSSWISSRLGCIAFNTDNSGVYSDLPNFNLSSIGIKRVSQEGTIWKLELSNPVSRNYQENTKIREHVEDPSGNYIYCSAWNAYVPFEWTEYKGMIYNSKKERFGKLPIGTEYVKIIIWGNFLQKSKDISLAFKNIKFEEFNQSFNEIL